MSAAATITGLNPGIETEVVSHQLAGEELVRRAAGADLVIDAAFGTGFRGTWNAPATHGEPVLAVDIPSGVDGVTGTASGSPLPADLTVTFQALKPGLLVGDLG